MNLRMNIAHSVPFSKRERAAVRVSEYMLPVQTKSTLSPEDSRLLLSISSLSLALRAGANSSDSIKRPLPSSTGFEKEGISDGQDIFGHLMETGMFVP